MLGQVDQRILIGPGQTHLNGFVRAAAHGGGQGDRGLGLWNLLQGRAQHRRNLGGGALPVGFVNQFQVNFDRVRAAAAGKDITAGTDLGADSGNFGDEAEHNLLDLAGRPVAGVEVGAGWHGDGDGNLPVIFLGHKFTPDHAADDQVNPAGQGDDCDHHHHELSEDIAQAQAQRGRIGAGQEAKPGLPQPQETVPEPLHRFEQDGENFDQATSWFLGGGFIFEPVGGQHRGQGKGYKQGQRGRGDNGDGVRVEELAHNAGDKSHRQVDHHVDQGNGQSGKANLAPTVHGGLFG